MLTLGLPTSATAAIMLSAFQSYGINPGPLLLQSQPQLVWGLIASLFIGNVMLLVLNLPLIAVWVKLLQIPAPLLYAGILVFATIGTYGITQSPVDLVLLYLIGGIGYLMRRYDFPDRAGHHRHDPGPAGRAELPPGHDDLGRRLDRVLHAAAVGDDPGAGGARAVRPQALSRSPSGPSPITCRAMRDSDFRIASGPSSGGAGERLSRAGRGLITCRRITCGRRLATQVEFENSRDHHHGLRSVAGLEHREFQRFHAIDEQAAAEAALVLDHPVAAAVAADLEQH